MTASQPTSEPNTALSQKIKDDFVYWITQYIKRKCIGAKIKETTLPDGVQFDWKWGPPTETSTPRKVFFSNKDMIAAMGVGADAIKKVIQCRVRAELPEMFPPDEQPTDPSTQTA